MTSGGTDEQPDSHEESDDDSMPSLEPVEAEIADEGRAEPDPSAPPPRAQTLAQLTQGLVQGAQVDSEDTAERWVVAPSDESDPDGAKRCIVCSDELCEEEYGYPKWPEEMKDPDYFREEFQRMRTDPRYNKNLGRGMDSQEFWNEAARLPWAKVLMRKEQYWLDRKSVWLQQFETVMRNNRGREEMVELLEDCPMELKRLVAPILKYRIVENLLLNVSRESKETGVPFRELVQQPEMVMELQRARQRLDEGGEEEARRIQDEFDSMVARAQGVLAEEQRREEKERGRIVIDMAGLKTALDFGQKCKKDGLLEFQKGNWEESLISWRQGDEALKRFRAPANCHDENMMIVDLHSAVLRNVAQAAIKLENWAEAIDAADRVLEMNPEDFKAWFRKACALEGLGKFDESRECLEKIEEIAVGRVDCERMVSDCTKKRDRLRALEERHGVDQQRMLQRGLRRGVFSSDRRLTAADSKRAGLPAPPRPPMPAAEAPLGARATGLPSATGREQAVAEEATAPQRPDEREEPPEEEAEAEARRKAAEEAVAKAEIERARRVPASRVLGDGDRKRVTRDGALDLLDDLEAAYSEPAFVKQVDKLIYDVRFDTRTFMQHLGGVALQAQQPVLEKWGFEASGSGVAEMRAAIQDHTRGPVADAELQERANQVNRALYGSPSLRMYERVMLGS